MLADFSALSELPDDKFSYWLTKEIGVPAELAWTRVRFAFCKTEAVLAEAAERLQRVKRLRG